MLYHLGATRRWWRRVAGILARRIRLVGVQLARVHNPERVESVLDRPQHAAGAVTKLAGKVFLLSEALAGSWCTFLVAPTPCSPVHVPSRAIAFLTKPLTSSCTLGSSERSDRIAVRCAVPSPACLALAITRARQGQRQGPRTEQESGEGAGEYKKVLTRRSGSRSRSPSSPSGTL